MHRFFVKESSLHATASCLGISERSILFRIRTVLRLKPGDRMVILDNTGRQYECAIHELKPGKLTASILRSWETTDNAKIRLIVYLSLIKSNRFDWAVEKLTEIGVTKIIPLACERSVIRTTGSTDKKLERWQAIIREAAEQCERSTMPDITAPIEFGRFLSQSSQEALRMICVERLEAPSLRQQLERICLQATRPNLISVAIGPEGGFTGQELKLASASGVIPVSLGPRVLRSETAAICSAAQVIARLEE